MFGIVRTRRICTTDRVADVTDKASGFGRQGYRWRPEG